MVTGTRVSLLHEKPQPGIAADPLPMSTSGYPFNLFSRLPQRGFLFLREKPPPRAAFSFQTRPRTLTQRNEGPKTERSQRSGILWAPDRRQRAERDYATNLVDTDERHSAATDLFMMPLTCGLSVASIGSATPRGTTCQGEVAKEENRSRQAVDNGSRYRLGAGPTNGGAMSSTPYLLNRTAISHDERSDGAPRRQYPITWREPSQP